MDVRINDVSSNVHVTDARAMLTPDVLAQIVKAVTAHLAEAERVRREREEDTKIDRRASDLD